MSGTRDVTLAVALASFFVAIQFYTSLAALSPTPPVGYVFLSRGAAAGLVALLLVTAAIAFARLWARRGLASPDMATSSQMLWCFALAAVPASLAGIDPGASLQVVGIGAAAAVFHLALVRWYARPPVALTVLAAYLGAGLLAAGASVVMVLARRPAELFALNHGRAAGPFVTTNQLGAFLVLDGFVALGAAMATRRPALRALAWSNLAIATIALGLSFSRGAWIGAAIAACVYAALLGARRTALAGLALSLVVAGLIAVRPVAGHNPAEAFTRISTLEGGARAASLFPLTGSGPMTYYRLFGSIRPSNGGLPGSFEALHPHNVVLSLAGELGIAGILATIAGWVVFARGIAARVRGAPEANRRFALGICAGFVALFVQGMADLVGVVEMTFVWIPYAALGIAAAAHGLAE